MELTAELLALLRCPECGAELAAGKESALACQGPKPHRFDEQEGFLTFARPMAGKYDPGYAARYAALWAFGYETLHSGADEPLYRAVSSLAGEALAGSAGERRGSRPLGARAVVVDAGCGVGRTLRSLATLAPEATILGLDGSLAMLELARTVVSSEEPIEVDLAGYGFGTLRIPPRPYPNAHLFRADIERFPVADGCADMVLSVNTIDRLAHGPERTLAEAHRVLRPGGTLVFTDPLNWTTPEAWSRYPDAQALLAFIESLGFEITTWFDDLLYRELLDARGSVEEFRTLVVAGRR